MNKLNIIILVRDENDELSLTVDSLTGIIDSSQIHVISNKKYNKIYELCNCKNVNYYFGENSNIISNLIHYINTVIIDDSYITIAFAGDIFLNNFNDLITPVQEKYDVITFSINLQFKKTFDNYDIIKPFFNNHAKINFTELIPNNSYNLIDQFFGHIFKTSILKKYLNELVIIDEFSYIEVIPKIFLNATKILSLDIVCYISKFEPNIRKIILNKQEDITISINNIFKHYSYVMDYYIKNVTIEEEKNKLILFSLFKIMHIPCGLSKKELKIFLSNLKKIQLYKYIGNIDLLNMFLFKFFPTATIICFLSTNYYEEYYMPEFNRKSFYYFLREISYNYGELRINKPTFKDRIFNISKNFIKEVFKHMFLLNKNNICLEYLELVITTKCSLKCKKCANFIPTYGKNAKNIPLNEIYHNIEELFKIVHRVSKFRILGGEPLLHPDLDKILEVLIHNPKIDKITVVTNGTILPTKKELIYMLSNKKVQLYISKYNRYSKRINEIVELCKQKNIHYKVLFNSNNDFWLDYGDKQSKNADAVQLREQFSSCSNIRKCKSLLNGKLHICPRSSHGMDLNIVPDNPIEYVDILDKSISYKNKKKNLKKLLDDTEYISACNYCNVGTENLKKIPVAEQE